MPIRVHSHMFLTLEPLHPLGGHRQWCCWKKEVFQMTLLCLVHIRVRSRCFNFYLRPSCLEKWDRLRNERGKAKGKHRTGKILTNKNRAEEFCFITCGHHSPMVRKLPCLTNSAGHLPDLSMPSSTYATLGHELCPSLPLTLGSDWIWFLPPLLCLCVWKDLEWDPAHCPAFPVLFAAKWFCKSLSFCRLPSLLHAMLSVPYSNNRRAAFSSNTKTPFAWRPHSSQVGSALWTSPRNALSFFSHSLFPAFCRHLLKCATHVTKGCFSFPRYSPAARLKCSSLNLSHGLPVGSGCITLTLWQWGLQMPSHVPNSGVMGERST